MESRVPVLIWAALIAAAGFAGCSGAQGDGPQTAGDVDTEGEGDGDEPGGDEGEEEGGEASAEPACVALESEEADPLRRWLPAFPIERGGVVLTFVGAEAELMDVEMGLEMAAIQGYEDLACGGAVVVWVPGFECEGREAELASRIEESTTMAHSETVCFRIDEVRLRIEQECANGTLPADRCP